MSVYTHVASRPTQALAFPVRNVLLRLRIPILLGHTEVDDVDDVLGLSTWPADEEVIGLDVTVDEGLLVNGLNTRNLCHRM